MPLRPVRSRNACDKVATGLGNVMSSGLGVILL